eukprot:7437563-Ditylum_brightwellii.AAC.1
MIKENPTKTTYPQRNFCKNINSKHVNNVEEDEHDASDLEDKEDNTKKKYQDTILNDSDVVNINEDQFNYESDHDSFHEASMASVMRIEESIGKGVEIFTESGEEQSCSTTLNWQEEDLTYQNEKN